MTIEQTLATGDPTRQPAPADARTSAQRLVDATVDDWAPRLITTSHALHANPEVAFEEYESAALLADLLRDAGFAVRTDVWGQPTAIDAVYGSGELTVVICAEYDALPGLGHACGHNIIASASAGAAIALATVADDLGLTVRLLGTPAEEMGGGKALMLEAGAWEDATVSLMAHPGPGVNLPTAAFGSQGRDRFRVSYAGRASHAAAAPSFGINAGDAATIAQVAIGLLRQQLPDRTRVSAVTLSTGAVSNIIPAGAVVEAEVRSFDAVEMADLKTRVLACFSGAATATGCTFTVEPVDPIYEPLIQDAFLADSYDAHLARRGRVFGEIPGGALGGGSTDMGNVSQVLPTVHPGIAVMGSMAMPHTADFAADTAGEGADAAVLDAAAALAGTIVDLATDPVARGRVLDLQAKRARGATQRPAYATVG